MKKTMAILLSAVLALSLCACGSSASGIANAATETDTAAYAVAVRVRINPEVNLYLDDTHTVIDAELVNADAKNLCVSEDLIGKPYDNALEFLVTESVSQGYAQNNSTIDVSVQGSAEDADAAFVLTDAKEVIQEVAQNQDIALFATTNDVDIDVWQQYASQGIDNMPEFCGVCRGTGICKNCQGTQTLLCGDCLGSREIPCYSCSGSGHLSGECTRCHGSGLMDCLRCSGTGRTECVRCHGTRVQACEYCNGDGKNHVTHTHDGHHLRDEEINQPCGRCHGSGIKQCTDCDNGYTRCTDNLGNHCQDGQVACEDCNGSGTLDQVACPYCGESHMLTCPACDGNGITGCPYCSSSGQCYDCGGSGIR